MEFIGQKISVVKKIDYLSMVISASTNKRSSYIILFWLICFTICGAIISSQYFKTNDEKFKVFLIVFTGFWLYFELRAVYAFLWKRFGKEIIKIKEGQLFLKKDILNRGKIAVFDRLYIKNLRVKVDEKQNSFTILGSMDWLTGTNSITFDYYGKEVSFGFMLNKPDAEKAVKLLRQQMR